jgi:hypothetical protein
MPTKNFGEFFIKAECRDNPHLSEHLTSFLKKIRLDINQYQSQLSGLDMFRPRVEAMRQVLFQKYLQQYSRERAGITDFLMGKGGNCEAQTKLVIDAFISSDFVFPLGKVLAVQMFTDHIQPVIYTPDRGEIFEIVSGKLLRSVVAPIFKPEILFHAYILGKGAKPVMSEGDLLIKSENVQTEEVKEHDYETSSTSAYQFGKGVYNAGEVPESTILSYVPEFDSDAGYKPLVDGDDSLPTSTTPSNIPGHIQIDYKIW